MLDVQYKLPLMKENPALPFPDRLQMEFEQLRQSLAKIGYITQGSVLERTVARSGRSGYQWTRKVEGKTISVSLSREQFDAMKAAVQNERQLWKTVQKMGKVSRQILFNTLPDTRRRKRLPKNVLGLN